MPNDIEEVKRRIDIVDLVGSYVTLKKAGKDYKALCPYHQEKTPSFFVSPEKQIFKCFGCGEGGDAFDFVMKQEGLEFGDALKLLADRAGVTLEPRTRIDRERPGLKSRLFTINRLSALFYHKILLEHPAGQQAREYLSSRGINPAAIREFRIGFAPSLGPLTTLLSRRGFTSAEIEQAGRPDRFTRRIIFPLFDVVGNIVGFSGRVLDHEDEPKYLNTPETAIFHKGRQLYGLFQAKKNIKEENQSIVVEGQMDVVMSHQSGVKNAVATSGTSLTGDHLSILYRYAPNLYLAFDTDPAGQKAAQRAILMALAQGFTVKLIPLSEKDPADLVKANPRQWREAIQNAQESISYIIDRAIGKFSTGSADQKKMVAKETIPYIAILPDPIEQESWVRLLANRLVVSEKSIYLALAKLLPQDQVKVVRPAPTAKKARPFLTAAETLIALLLVYPDKGEKVVKELDEALLENASLIEIFRAVKKEWAQLKKNPREASKILNPLLTPEQSKVADFLTFSVARDFPDETEASATMYELLSRLTDRRSEELKREYSAKIAQAEASGRREDVKKLMQEFQTLISK